MLTRCPHCATAFRVTPEQIKARQGRVRCGACQGVFNALDSLADEAPIVLAPPAPAESVPVAPPSSATPVDAPPPDAAALPEAPPVETNEPLPTEPDPRPNDAQDTPDAVATAADDLDFPPITVAPPAAAAADVPENRPWRDADAVPDRDEDFAPTAPAEHAPTGHDHADTAAEPVDPVPPPARRWPWIAGLVVLVLVAAGQLLVAYRVELAVLAPEARPALAAFCAPLGCAVPRPSRRELIDIESSDLLTPANSDNLLLFATLKNRAPFDQEYPHLELTLTDVRDAALVRKVLAPAEYLPAGQSPAGGFPARGDIAVKLALAAPGVPAIGFRLGFFYP